MARRRGRSNTSSGGGGVARATGRKAARHSRSKGIRSTPEHESRDRSSSGTRSASRSSSNDRDDNLDDDAPRPALALDFSSFLVARARAQMNSTNKTDGPHKAHGTTNGTVAGRGSREQDGATAAMRSLVEDDDAEIVAADDSAAVEYLLGVRREANKLPTVVKREVSRKSAPVRRKVEQGDVGTVSLLPFIADLDRSTIPGQKSLRTDTEIDLDNTLLEYFDSVHKTLTVYRKRLLYIDPTKPLDDLQDEDEDSDKNDQDSVDDDDDDVDVDCKDNNDQPASEDEHELEEGECDMTEDDVSETFESDYESNNDVEEEQKDNTPVAGDVVFVRGDLAQGKTVIPTHNLKLAAQVFIPSKRASSKVWQRFMYGGVIPAQTSSRKSTNNSSDITNSARGTTTRNVTVNPDGSFTVKPTEPTLSILIRMEQSTALNVLSMHNEWLKENRSTFTFAESQWIYALLMRLDPEVSPSEISGLRDLAKAMIEVRSNVSESNFGLELPRQVNWLTMLIKVINLKFGQRDLV